VAALLVERRINAVPVVDAGGRLRGIVSEAGLPQGGWDNRDPGHYHASVSQVTG
jgi:CBS-domain-containing membrane protein